MVKKVLVRMKEEDLLYEEKLEILSGNVCKSIFPISIIKERDNISGYYDTSGFRKLSSFQELSAENTLTVLELLANAMEECKDYLIFPEEYILNLDTVYIDRYFSTVKFTYIPDARKVSVKKKILYFICELKKIASENGRMYLEILYQLFDTDNIYALKIKLFISELKREVIKNQIF